MIYKIKPVDLTKENVTELEKTRFKSFGVDFDLDITDSLIEYIKENYYIIGLYDGERLVGAAYISNSSNYLSYQLDRFFIDPEYQGKGCGRVLINALVDFKEVIAEYFGYVCDSLTLDSVENAEGFYKRMEFSKDKGRSYYKAFIKE